MVSFQNEGPLWYKEKNKTKQALDSNGLSFESPSLVGCVTLVK